MTAQFDAFVLPTGIKSHDGETRLEASLVFRPFTEGQDDAQSPLITNWPGYAAQRVFEIQNQSGSDNLGVIIYPTTKPTKGSPSIATGGASSKTVRSRLNDCYHAKPPVGTDLAKDVERLWGRLFSDQGGGRFAAKSFNDFCKTLTRRKNAARLLTDTLQGSAPKSDAVPKADKAAGGDKTPNPNNYNSAPDIVSVPHAELSHLLALRRAQAIGERIANTASRPPRLPGDNKGAPWTKSARIVLRHHGKDWETRPLSSDESQAQTLKLQADALRAEKAELDKILQAKLNPRRVYARKIAEADKSPEKPDFQKKCEGLVSARAQMHADSGVYGAAKAIGDGKFDTKREDKLSTHVSATLPDPDAPEQNSPSAVANRWATVLGMPSLQRLLHLTVDIEARFENNSFPPVDGFYALEFVCVGAPCSSHKTLVKIAGQSIWPCTEEEWLAGGNDCWTGAIDQFAGVLDLEQSIAQRPDDPSSPPSHRFSIDTLDVHMASESEVQRDRGVAYAETAKADGYGFIHDDLIDAVGAERKLKTAGLQIFDQWRDSVAIKQFMRAYASTNPKKNADEQTSVPDEDADRPLDADDLTAGLRLDVAFKDGVSSRLWSCLTNRRLTYSKKQDVGGGHIVNVEALIDLFINHGMNEPTSRLVVDGVIIGMPSRLLKNDPANVIAGAENPGASAGVQTAFQETSVAVWDGDPLGVRCKVQTTQVPFDGLPLDLTLDLPTEAYLHTLQPNLRPVLPPKLRFGAPYWFGARTVLLGGVALPLEKATVFYNAKNSMALPKNDELRRFLRHEWIDAPMVATPWPYVQQEFAPDGRGGLDGETLIVRSLDANESDESDEKDEDRRRYGPGKTSRVLFAPRVDFTFAHLHGVFDPGRGAHPNVGGLKGVDFDPPRGGFPAFPTDRPPLPGNIRFDAPPRKKESHGQLLCQSPKDEPQIEASGLAIFRPPSPPTVKKAGVLSEDLYFPDPAARHLAIALRRPWRGGEFLDDDAILVPLYPDAKTPKGAATPGYPDAVPVVLSIVAMPAGHDSPLVCHDQLLKRAGAKTHYSRVAIEQKKKAIGGNLALEVRIYLTPGEDFEIVAWVVPEVAHIGAWFDAPESLAFLSQALCDHDKCSSNSQPSAASPLSNLTDLMKSIAATKPSGQVARREEACVSISLVKTAAEKIRNALLKRPIPEFAAPRRLRATHAAEKPAIAPEILTKPNEIKLDPDSRLLETVAFRRLNKTNRSDILNLSGSGGLGPGDDGDATTLLVDANVTADLNTVDAIELRVTAAAPTARPLDNILLGRSPEFRIRGDWPKEPQASNLGTDVASASRRLYGFDVYEDGRIRVPVETAVMQRWRIHPTNEQFTGPRENAVLSLLELTALAEPKDQTNANAAGETQANGEKAKAASSQADENLFADGTARRVRSQIFATSRTARLIPERRVYPDPTKQATDERRRHLPSRFKGSDAPCDQPTSIIRSVVRPAALPVKSLLPAFVWSEPVTATKSVVAKSRSTRIRIPFNRPAMTSGIEERLGIVLWPPNIAEAWIDPYDRWDIARLGNGQVMRAEPLTQGEADIVDVMNLSKSADWRRGFFTDDDLGPGGSYITRWGADPIHAAGELSWFIGLHSFTDLPYWQWRETAVDSIAAEDKDTGVLWPEADIYKPRLVENVLMPLPKSKDSGAEPTETNDAGGASADSSQTSPAANPSPVADQQFMMVSLLTYAPRFDVDAERWYVDVEIDAGGSPDPFLRLGLVRFQPHASRELQVSYPTKEWVQVVGRRRDVRLEVRPAEEKKKCCAVVTVESPLIDQIDTAASNTRHVVTTKPVEQGDGDRSPEAPVAVIRATLIERVNAEAGYVVERIVRNPDMTNVSAEIGVRDGRPLSAELKLDLPDGYATRPSTRYFVFVEEFWRMRRGDLDEEPVEAMEEIPRVTEAKFWRDSGPRFSVELQIPMPE